jgi:mono/diheme cytochrome c family protein
MKKFSIIFISVFIGLSLLVLLFEEEKPIKEIAIKPQTEQNFQRWYTQSQVENGKQVFANNCASCHGYNAEKTKDWTKTLVDGSYPPPPLNDKAHAWHHPYSQLVSIIKKGGKPYKGNMPAFQDTLNDDEIDEAIAYFQSFWSDKYYGYWIQRGGK